MVLAVQLFNKIKRKKTTTKKDKLCFAVFLTCLCQRKLIFGINFLPFVCFLIIII